MQPEISSAFWGSIGREQGPQTPGGFSRVHGRFGVLHLQKGLQHLSHPGARRAVAKHLHDLAPIEHRAPDGRAKGRGLGFKTLQTLFQARQLTQNRCQLFIGLPLGQDIAVAEGKNRPPLDAFFSHAAQKATQCRILGILQPRRQHMGTHQGTE